MKRNAAMAMLTAAFAATSAHAILSWANCKDIAPTDFKAVVLANRSVDKVSEPMKMAFDLLAGKGEDAKGKVDVYFTERMGKVRKFDSKTGTVLTLATFTLNVDQGNSSDGMLGIALDPAFKTNNYAYIYYTFIGAGEKSWRISRFTLNAAHTVLDPASEAVLLRIPINSGSKHPGGALQFDAWGDLWITSGNDYKLGSDFPMYSSPNTNDLRGKILRIHPNANGTSYTIPEGNLFKPGTANTRPEIYVMGNRNPYTLSLDPVRRWAVWGDVGPDNLNSLGKPMNNGGPEQTEEYDLVKAPGNSGYPFFSGDFATVPGSDASNLSMPANYSWEGAQPGLAKLPPAFAPIYPYKKSCAITGPIYRYDGDLVSSIKFPPHFQRKWLVTDFNGDNNKINVFTLNDDGTAITAQDKNVISGIPLHGPLDMQTGPDGALYVNNYDGYRTSGPNTSIIRIEYTGDCHPAEPKLETVATSAFRPSRPEMAFSGPRVDVTQQASGLSVAVATEGAFALEVRDLAGRPVASRNARGSAPVSLAEVRDPGIYFLRVKSAAGNQIIKFVRD